MHWDQWVVLGCCLGFVVLFVRAGVLRLQAWSRGEDWGGYTGDPWGDDDV